MRPLANGLTLYYHSPGCGLEDTAVFTRYLGTDQARTELFRADLRTGATARVAAMDGS